MIKSIHLYLLLFLMIPVKFSHADSMLFPANRDSIQFEQRQRLESEKQQREALEHQNTLMIDPGLRNENRNALCFKIAKIRLMGVSVFKSTVNQRWISLYQGQCLSLETVQNLTKKITNEYIEKGYITSQAFIPEQDLSSQNLSIQVIEGRIESIIIEGSPPRLAAMTFPHLTGGILNLRDIEQGLEQLNRSASARYTIDIQPGIEPGYSRVIIQKNARRVPLSGQLNLNNSGNESTGKQLLTGNLTADSPFGLGEQWSVGVSTDTDLSRSRHSRYYVASVNVPYGYWSYQYQFYRNNTLQPFNISSQKYPYEGKNTHQQFDVSRLIYRDGQQRFTLQSSLKHKNASTRLASQTLTVSSPTLTSLALAPQYSTTLGQGYFTFNPAAEWGISAFGASPDYLAKDSPRNHYRKFNLSSSYQYYFSTGLTYLTSFYGQYSPDNLYGIERISIGGQYSVRGYHEQSLSGNRGGYWRNEINKDIASTAIGQFRVISALDFGFIGADKYQVEHVSLMGGAVGLSLTHNRDFYSQFILSKPLHYPAQFKPDNWSAYWSVSLFL